jgi:hypothetical protein
MEWIYVKHRTPITYRSGEWDGLNSDQVLVEDVNGIKYLAVFCEGYMDGSEFAEWYDDRYCEIISKIVKWCEIPD